MGFFMVALALGGIGLASTQMGQLAPGDTQLESGEYADGHAYPGTAGETIRVTLTSEAFDPYLVVLDPNNAPIAEVDDSEGHGLNVDTTIVLPMDGTYLVVVTSARAEEVGSYTLTIEGTEAAGTPAAEQPRSADPFTGRFSDGRLTVTLQQEGGAYRGVFELDGQAFPAVAAREADGLRGTFTSAGHDFPFEATATPEGLDLSTGGVSYVLARFGGATQPEPAAPAAQPSPTPQPAPAAQLPPVAAGAAPVEQVPLEPRIAPQPGFVTGTVFDTAGRPLPGAGVLIRGVTFGAGENVSFETTTGADGTYAQRVPAGVYEAKAWIDVTYRGSFYSRLLHPVAGNPNTQIDSEVGGNLDFHWKLTGLSAWSTPPGTEYTDFYGASIDLSYCGLPADAYCSAAYDGNPGRPIAPAGSTVRVTLEPTAPLIDGSTGQVLVYEFPVTPRDPEYPYGEGIFPEYPNGGGGRTTLGAMWEYHGEDFNDIPLGTYRVSMTAILPDGLTQPFLVGTDAEDVSYGSVEVAFLPWDDFHARSYIGGGLQQTTIYVRD